MARYTDSKCRLCRRAGEKLFLKGDRCQGPKCAMVRKPYAPGMHGQKGSRGGSEYGKQLAMKQRIKRIYGVLERQFRKHFDEIKNKKGVTGDLLLVRLESRLDNVVYRCGIASSRSQARQMVTHGIIAVNGGKVDVPAYEVKEGDTIAIRKEKIDKAFVAGLKERLKTSQGTPVWLAFDTSKYLCSVLARPSREDIDANVDPQLVVEYYSK